MHQFLMNEATFTLAMKSNGPLLVKSGGSSLDPTRPNMEFVRTKKGGMETVYIPGSSLKGTVRAYSERVCRTLELNVCDPFDEGSPCRTVDKQHSGAADKQARGEPPLLAEEHDHIHSQEGDQKGGGSAVSEQRSGAFAYKTVCPICRIFGSTDIAARVRFVDAFPDTLGEQSVSTRMGVAIDRVLGSVAVGPFELEVADSMPFTIKFSLTNFELWQLALMGLVVRDLCAGRIPVGFGKSRGLGQVEGKLKEVELRSFKQEGLELEGALLSVRGIASMLPDKVAKDYDFGDRSSDVVTVPLSGQARLEDDYLDRVISLESKQAEELFRACVAGPWAPFLDRERARARR